MPPAAGWTMLYQGSMSISIAGGAFGRQCSNASLGALVKGNALGNTSGGFLSLTKQVFPNIPVH